MRLFLLLLKESTLSVSASLVITARRAVDRLLGVVRHLSTTPTVSGSTLVSTDAAEASKPIVQVPYNLQDSDYRYNAEEGLNILASRDKRA